MVPFKGKNQPGLFNHKEMTALDSAKALLIKEKINDLAETKKEMEVFLRTKGKDLPTREREEFQQQLQNVSCALEFCEFELNRASDQYPQLFDTSLLKATAIF